MDTGRLWDLLERWSDRLSWWESLVLAVVELNPSPAIQAVVARDSSLAGDLFYVSFKAVWRIEGRISSKLVHVLEGILGSPTVATVVVETVLSLIEFMDLAGEPLPVSTVAVAVAAEQHQLFSKALFFRELEFRESAALPSSECVESLIAVNIKVGNTESVHGLLRSPAVEFIRVRPSWHEKLENWSAALNAYSVRLLSEPDNLDWTLGRLHCLAALGEWDRLLVAAENCAHPLQVSSLKATACFHTQRWAELETALKELSGKLDFDDLIHAASLAIYKREYAQAAALLSDAGSLLEKAKYISNSSISTSNQRTYTNHLKLLQVTQLGEIMQFAQSGPVLRAELRSLWGQRLLDLDYTVEVWRRLVPMRALVLSPFTEDVDIWIRFSTLCRKKQNLGMSNRIVEMLETNAPTYHGVVLSRIKNIYATGNVSLASERLLTFLTSKEAAACSNYLLSKCYNALGLWLPHNDMRVESLLTKSVSLNPESYKSLSSLALLKFKELSSGGLGSSPDEAIEEATNALFRCIALSTRSAPLQDVLRLLTVWFRFYGQKSESVDAVMEAGFASVPLSTWIQAIPQILARLKSKRPKLRASIASLMTRVGEAYPQSVVFPLTVAAVSSDTCRAILGSVRKICPVLVAESELVATQLVRISISWLEQWASALEEASRLYFVDDNVEGMKEVLAKVHAETLDREGDLSLNEKAFVREFAFELNGAKSWHANDQGHKDSRFYLEQGWQMYYESFQRIHKEAACVRRLSLEDASPELANCTGLSVLVPGSSVGIHSFVDEVEVLSSKQRPRILNVVGKDGRMYKFLLKGNEDLKQDERVMQLFGLVNSVIAESVASRRRSGVFPNTPGIETLENVTIRRFAVIPLSNNAGLIEWVPHCDTLHSLIKECREKDGVPLSIEHNIMRTVYAKYEDLPLIGRMEIFNQALSQTAGDELRRILWLHSGGTDAWLAQRMMYARSLAVTSIVGHILGLGDRHPSNLMIERATGQVIHIDFGDCFDVAATRERYPEKIPFRLTRQLVSALEVAGIDGTFRVTCERMVDLIRKNIDTILAMLEAFIYDPLITWRLLGDSPDSAAEPLTDRARELVQRVHTKLTGESSIAVQVDRLIQEAAAHENLCQCYLGWCPFW